MQYMRTAFLCGVSLLVVSAASANGLLDGSALTVTLSPLAPANTVSLGPNVTVDLIGGPEYMAVIGALGGQLNDVHVNIDFAEEFLFFEIHTGSGSLLPTAVNDFNLLFTGLDFTSGFELGSVTIFDPDPLFTSGTVTSASNPDDLLLSFTGIGIPDGDPDGFETMDLSVQLNLVEAGSGGGGTLTPPGPIPEPASVALLGMGILGTLLRGKAKKPVL